MDSLISLAKQGIAAYENSHGGHPQAQPQQHHEAQAVPHLDHDQVVNKAQDHTGHSGDNDLFSCAMGLLANHHGEHTKPINEEHVTSSHKEAYEKGNAGGLDAGSMGAAAAMQAFKLFASKHGASSAASNSGTHGSGSSQLISLAMSEASKLFDKSGGSSSGGKQDAINGAAMTMMKLVVQSKLGGGGNHSGGLGSLLGLAKQFL